MIVIYLRSSSINTFNKWCPQQYFIRYVLGFEDEPKKRTVMGTVVHKVMELIAAAHKFEGKKAGGFEIKDKELGSVYIGGDFYDETITLSESEAARINEQRKVNPRGRNYLADASVKPGDKRTGAETIYAITTKAFNHYNLKPKDKPFEPDDFEICLDWVWAALDAKGGVFDPRNRKIVGVENNFDITIKKPWAKFSYEINGELIGGYLAFRGTIDFLTEENPDTLHIIDYKTGERKDWNTGKKKEYSDLQKDPQLMLYYYAAKNMFPQYKNVLLTINFIRDGGSYTICFDEDTYEKAEMILKRTFLNIKACERPELRDESRESFQCARLCKFAKDDFQNSGKCTCQYVQEYVIKHGIDKTTADLKIGDNYAKYQNPGE